ncbi:hypothetical protein ACFLSJ_07420 [Verrucomicrobiota bacterium]
MDQSKPVAMTRQMQPNADPDAIVIHMGLVCLLVGLAAAAVLARGFMKKAGAGNDDYQQSFSTALPIVQAGVATPESRAAEGAEREETKSTLWGSPLDSLASLNKVASEKDAVFVFLPAGSDEEVKTIKEQIEAAARKAISRGTTMAAFTLDKNARDYAQTSDQVPAPCVLTMVKGGGMSVVARDITEAKLLQALVAASRPSGCGPSACGPGACP